MYCYLTSTTLHSNPVKMISFHCNSRPVTGSNSVGFTHTVSTGQQNNHFANHPVRLSNPSILMEQEMEWMETETVSSNCSLSQRKVREEIRSILNPGVTEETLNSILEQLDHECLHINNRNLCSLELEEICSFLSERLSVRSYHSSSCVQSLCRGKAIGEQQLIRLFSDYPIKTELAIKHYMQSDYNHRTCGNNILFRAGKFTSPDDEMGRCRNTILKRRVFEPESVNIRLKVHGSGLYSTPDLRAAKGYLQKSYNIDHPIVILAIHIKVGQTLLDISGNGNFSRFLARNYTDLQGQIRSDIIKDKCYINNCIYIMAAKETECGYSLIKDPDSILKISPYDFSMLTKVHIPFTSEEIQKYNLRCQQLSSSTVTTENIGEYPIRDHPDHPKQLLPVYRYKTVFKRTLNKIDYQDRYNMSFNQNEDMNEYKFFTIINGERIRVRPTARPYENSRDFINPEFNIQYKS